ncbi:tRNA dihydrouridine synthase [Gorillibacterium timonense]|uniref:tRNA dihydrouridine synthase n=1 Tax=Gorillibacterium timonense TaxID=1689269 RepID=UPI00071D9176|nr:tRNA-dihydrouridine synthase family protein [Gorillibacterium timonense]
MKFYFAPMEGLTGHIYRNVHHAFFKNVDKYFSPFIVPQQNESFKTRDIQDLLPEHNQGLVLIPQVLTNNAKDFLHTSKKLERLGYQEININLGCPSRTVVSKHKGSGFLAKREELDQFLDEIFAHAETKISLKTRLGKDEPEEFYALLDIFNKYPLEELIIHPRIQKDFYKNTPNLDIFKHALENSKNPVCYNGDIFTTKAYQEISAKFPTVDTFMLGRGLLSNPGLISGITDTRKIDKTLLKDFHDQVYEGYKGVLFGDTNVLYKMKELWFYMIQVFSDNAPYVKKIRKSQRLSDYDEAVTSLFREQELLEDRV